MDRHVYTHETVQHPYARVRRLLEDHPAALFHTEAPVGETTVETTLSSHVLSTDVVRRIDVRIGVFRDAGHGVCYRHVSWRSSDLPQLYPRMIGEIEATELGDDRVQISFIGRYRPPLQPLGGVGDVLGLHHVAEEAVGNLLLHVVGNIEQLCEEPAERADLPMVRVPASSGGGALQTRIARAPR